MNILDSYVEGQGYNEGLKFVLICLDDILWTVGPSSSIKQNKQTKNHAKKKGGGGGGGSSFNVVVTVKAHMIKVFLLDLLK